MEASFNESDLSYYLTWNDQELIIAKNNILKVDFDLLTSNPPQFGVGIHLRNNIAVNKVSKTISFHIASNKSRTLILNKVISVTVFEHPLFNMGKSIEIPGEIIHPFVKALWLQYSKRPAWFSWPEQEKPIQKTDQGMIITSKSDVRALEEARSLLSKKSNLVALARRAVEKLGPEALDEDFSPDYRMIDLVVDLADILENEWSKNNG